MLLLYEHFYTTTCEYFIWVIVQPSKHTLSEENYTRRDRSRDGAFKGGGKYKFWKLPQTTLFASPTIGKIKRRVQCTNI